MVSLQHALGAPRRPSLSTLAGYWDVRGVVLYGGQLYVSDSWLDLGWEGEG
jgi:hypothetical protein